MPASSQYEVMAAKDMQQSVSGNFPPSQQSFTPGDTSTVRNQDGSALSQPWELELVEVFAMFEAGFATTSRPGGLSAEGESLVRLRARLWLLARECPQGLTYGFETLETLQMTISARSDAKNFLYLGRPEDYVSAKSKGFIAVTSQERPMDLAGSQPSKESPIVSFFMANRPSHCESAPGSRWPQRLSVQRNSGFAGGGVRGFRRDAVNEMGEGGTRSRIGVPIGLQAIVAAASAGKGKAKVESEGSDENDLDLDDSDDDLQYFSAGEE